MQGYAGAKILVSVAGRFVAVEFDSPSNNGFKRGPSAQSVEQRTENKRLHQLVSVKANLSRQCKVMPELKSLCGWPPVLWIARYRLYLQHSGQVAQSVEQRTENPCVGGSIPPLATTPHCVAR